MANTYREVLCPFCGQEIFLSEEAWQSAKERWDSPNGQCIDHQAYRDLQHVVDHFPPVLKSLAFGLECPKCRDLMTGPWGLAYHLTTRPQCAAALLMAFF